jgi:hypothetical protein
MRRLIPFVHQRVGDHGIASPDDVGSVKKVQPTLV